MKDCRERLVELYRNTYRTFNEVVVILREEGYSDDEIDNAVLNVLSNEEHEEG